MDLTTEQIYALIGLAVFQMVGAAILYWVANSSGYRAGRMHGYEDGHETATDQLMPELDEMTARCTSAERLLTATKNELRRVEDERDQNHRNAREALEEMSQQLADAQVLNDAHAVLLRQAAGKFERLASLQIINLTDDARHAVTLAGQLRDLAGWLKPQTRQMERAA